MDDINLIEDYFRRYIKNISNWIPEGIVDVDLKLLHKMNLLHYHKQETMDPSLTRYFHVIETSEKITLINEKYIVWIMPEKVNNEPITYTLIALNLPDHPHLELAFATSGIYNSSRLVLKVLEMFLSEIQDTEETLLKLSKAS